MERAVLSAFPGRASLRTARRHLRQARCRLLDASDRLLFPEASSAAEHWQRMPMNAAVDEYIASLDPSACSAAEISGEGHADKPWREYTTLAYPDFDLCAPLEDPGAFDVVICEQVLEHVVDPWAAAANLCGLCVAGGRVIVTTPFLLRVHELPMYGMWDYWRFTPRGIQILLERGGLELDAVGAWGNRQCVVGNFSRWAAYRRWHSLRNELNLPVQVWAFAHRP
jgi:SAM-dependent methyltransferase